MEEFSGLPAWAQFIGTLMVATVAAVAALYSYRSKITANASSPDLVIAGAIISDGELGKSMAADVHCIANALGRVADVMEKRATEEEIERRVEELVHDRVREELVRRGKI